MTSVTYDLVQSVKETWGSARMAVMEQAHYSCFAQLDRVEYPKHYETYCLLVRRTRYWIKEHRLAVDHLAAHSAFLTEDATAFLRHARKCLTDLDVPA